MAAIDYRKLHRPESEAESSSKLVTANGSESSIPGAEPPGTWLDWVVSKCSLEDRDAGLIGMALARMAPRDQEWAVRRYVAAWQAAADDEPQPHRKVSAGRQAANQTLLPTSHRPMATGSTRQPIATTEPPSLPAGVRMAWMIRVGDKRLVLAGTPYTREQAQQAAEARWPGTDVEVLTDAG